jgi:hypothetical protein
MSTGTKLLTPSAFRIGLAGTFAGRPQHLAQSLTLPSDKTLALWQDEPKGRLLERK